MDQELQVMAFFSPKEQKWKQKPKHQQKQYNPTLKGGCQIQCWGRFYEGRRAKRSETLCKFDPHGKLVHLLTFYTKLKNEFSLWTDAGYRYHSTKYEQQHH